MCTCVRDTINARFQGHIVDEGLVWQVQMMLEDAEVLERLKSVRKYANNVEAPFPIAPERPEQLDPNFAYPLQDWVTPAEEIVVSR